MDAAKDLNDEVETPFIGLNAFGKRGFEFFLPTMSAVTIKAIMITNGTKTSQPAR